ncbi:MAG: hypothetical protein QMO91_04200 [Candidatus Tisiphia sp.]|nr:hypothetical protein [Candidatus Tisiphia sp.]
MPLISNHTKETSKRFQKKAYRPWDNDLLNPEHTKIIDSTSSNNLSTDTQITPVHYHDTLGICNNIDQPSSSLVSKVLTQDSVNLDLRKELRNLFGAQKVIMQYLLKQIEEEDSTYLITKVIAREECIKKCNLTSNTIKGALQQLKFKKLLEPHENKHGRGGYARYKFNKEVYSFFSNNLDS